MTGIRVTPEQLQTLAGRVHMGAGSIDAELRGLTASLAPLGTDWAGMAQTRFHELWNQWHTSALSLQQALEGISGMMQQAGGSYAQAEQSIAASFGR